MDNVTRNSDLMEKLMTVESEADLNRLLREYNIVLEEGVTSKQFFEAMNANDCVELNEQSLEAVAGGVIITPTIIAAATVVGLSIAAYIKWRKIKQNLR